ncbi:MAG: hypothetical protein IPP48_14100 [Chitinophagaceae bacterium]|nr:hypothetical protein [Chitinophagaceae bacterium]
MPVFVEHNFITIKDGVGSYCLYQGNLSVNENEKAVSWLLQNVFSKTTVPFIIAGKNPSKKLVR